MLHSDVFKRVIKVQFVLNAYALLSVIHSLIISVQTDNSILHFNNNVEMQFLKILKIQNVWQIGGSSKIDLWRR